MWKRLCFGGIVTLYVGACTTVPVDSDPNPIVSEADSTIVEPSPQQGNPDPLMGVWSVTYSGGSRPTGDRPLLICGRDVDSRYQALLDSQPVFITRTDNQISFEFYVNATAAGRTIRDVWITYAYSGNISDNEIGGAYTFIREDDLAEGTVIRMPFDAALYDSPVSWTATRVPERPDGEESKALEQACARFSSAI
ncbi:MAG: hypothetical protein AAF265_07020 [Pseudomonadota bacterium]